jgi:hypothetical protein
MLQHTAARVLPGLAALSLELTAVVRTTDRQFFWYEKELAVIYRK